MDIPEMHSTDTVREQTAKLHKMNQDHRTEEAESHTNAWKRVSRDIFIGATGLAIKSNQFQEYLGSAIAPEYRETIKNSLEILGLTLGLGAIVAIGAEAYSYFAYKYRKPYVSMWNDNDTPSSHRNS